MKRCCLFILILLPVSLLILFGCGQTSSNNNEDAVEELVLRQRVSGAISTRGEVDWYHYRAVEANNILRVHCSSNTYRPDVDLLATVYQENEEGKKVRLYADHALEESLLPADITMNIYIDTPKDIYISIRDLMDDECSDNPYYLSIDFAEGAEGNENFAQAVSLIVDNEDTCHSDCIGYIGDVDCYTFEAQVDGVYEISIAFSPFPGGTDVVLSIDLYDNQGMIRESLSCSQQNNYRLMPYLTAGEYYILIDDYGKDDFDTASTYQICVSSVNTDEKYENDTIERASSMEYEYSTCTYSVSGSLDYSQDMDWYQFSLQQIDTEGFNVLSISFDDGDEGIINFMYQISVQDSEENILLSHNYPGGSSLYQTQIKAGEGDHSVIIQAASQQMISQKAPYQVSIQVLDVVDEAEEMVKLLDPNTGETVTGNNTIYTADELVSDTICKGKIGYRGDEDWYFIDLEDTTRPKILEVFLDTNSQPSYVDHYVSLIRDNVIKKVFNSTGEYEPTELKMSLLIPALESLVPVTYYLRVCDYQGDDGDGHTGYRIGAHIRDIPESLPPDLMIDANQVIYYSETGEIEDETAAVVKLEHTSLIQKEYKVNTTILNFNDPNYAHFYDSNHPHFHDPTYTRGIIFEKGLDSTIITFPLVAGYIDFQGDQDWFEIDLGPLYDGNGPAVDWYYDIKIDFHVGSPGSAVEYVWKFYRDRNQNQILVDRPQDSDGFIASAGDTGTDILPFDISIPTEGTDEEFWVGDAWAGKFYLSISDFNYVNSEHPDDDWGYEGAPYYFKLSLVYHPGESYP